MNINYNLIKRHPSDDWWYSKFKSQFEEFKSYEPFGVKKNKLLTIIYFSNKFNIKIANFYFNRVSDIFPDIKKS